MYFFVPGSSGIFVPKTLGRKFSKIFEKLDRAIQTSELPSRQAKIAPGISYVVEPTNLFFWALSNDIVLPKYLQAHFCISQMSERQLNPWKTKVKSKIVAQNEIAKYNSENVSDLIKHLEDFNIKILRKDLNTLFEMKGMNGRPPKDCKKLLNHRHFKIKALPEVLKFHNKKFYCNFALLKEAINSAVNYIAEHIGCWGFHEKGWLDREDVCPIFINEMLNNRVIHLYVKDSPKIIYDFVIGILQRTFYRLQDKYEHVRFVSSIGSNQ